MVVSVSHLAKYYNVSQKEPGLLGSIKSLVRRRYEMVKAVEDISFEISEGELVGFIGPNGAGKTTTLKCLSGLLYPTRGAISVLGLTPYERKNIFLKQIGFVMGQKNQLWWELPAMDTFLLNKEIYDISKVQFTQTLDTLSHLLAVEDIVKIPVKKLSLGQRMKMELIAALIHSPKVLFLDEPTIGLDVTMQKRLREFIKEYNSRYKATIVLTSHYMGDVEALCKRIIVINHGKIIFDGILKNLIKKYAPYKTISVTLEEDIDLKKIDSFLEVRWFVYPKLVLNVENEKVSHVASQILKNFKTRDLTIEDPDIEDVIRKVYE